MGVDSTWIPAFDAHLTIGGTEMPAISASVDRDIEEFETTNTTSAGNFEFGTAVTTTSFQCSIPVDSEDPIIPAEKDLLAGGYSDGVNTFTGKLRVTKVGRKFGGKGGLTLDISGKFTGAVVKT